MSITPIKLSKNYGLDNYTASINKGFVKRNQSQDLKYRKPNRQFKRGLIRSSLSVYGKDKRPKKQKELLPKARKDGLQVTERLLGRYTLPDLPKVAKPKKYIINREDLATAILCPVRKRK